MNQRERILIFLCIGLLSVFGCRKPESDSTSEGVSYDPKNDPLVNPASLFEPPPKDQTQIATDETLYLQLDGSPNTLNPIFLSSQYEMIVSSIFFTGPFTIDKEMKWKINEELVESFEESEDHKEFIVKLKPGFTWQDGRPFTAHDIVYSWQEILDPCVPCLTSKPGTDKVTECVALNDYTVKYVQDEPLATRLWNIGFSIIPKHIFEKDKKNHPDLKTGQYYNQQNRHPVGSGPYKIVEWKEHDKIVAERWEGYKGKKPYFKRIVFRIIPDNNVALLSFEKQGVDVVEQLSPQQFAFETNSGSFSKVGVKVLGTEWSFGYIGWNMDGSNPFFADKRVRYAMTHALNIPLILDKVYCNLATQAQGIYHPDSWMYNPKVKEILMDYDLEKSRAYLDEAGWKVDPQDGWRYKQIQGKKVKFEFTLLMSQGSPIAPQMAAIFQEDLKKVGVSMKTRQVEWSSFVQTVRKHEFQAETAGWGTGADPDMGWNLWRTEEYKTGRNYGGYSNPKVDELFELGRKEFDFEKRRKIYQQIHLLIYEDQPYIWIYNRPIKAAFNKRIRGVQTGPRGIYLFDPSFEAWWVAKANPIKAN